MRLFTPGEHNFCTSIVLNAGYESGRMVRRNPVQCPSSAPAPPQDTPGGSGRLDTLTGEAGPLGALPPPRLLEAASSRVADSTAFVLLSTPGTFSSLATVTGVSSVTTGVNSYFKSWFG